MALSGLLIASPQLRDPNFHHTVVLLCHHDDQGALGLVLTREGAVRVDEVLARLEIDAGQPFPALTGWGGPVGDGVGFVIWRGEVGAHEGWSLDDQVAVSPSAERLARLVTDGADFDLLLGYAGWGPGQLEAELDEGSWLFADIDHRVVLETPRGGRYEAALALLGLSPELLFMRPIDA
jgi:putative transcriptional regulator